jgi:hypothetical protein
MHVATVSEGMRDLQIVALLFDPTRFFPKRFSLFSCSINQDPKGVYKKSCMYSAGIVKVWRLTTAIFRN